jgi:hypothetical protein
MEWDFSNMATADVAELDRLSTALGDIMMTRLRAAHPRDRLMLFFPVALNGVPDCDFVRTYGEDVLYDVLEATDTIFRALRARAELESRGLPN